MKLKALSFRQPWADLVLDGKKTLDLRTWRTHHRGPLAVYASQTIEKEHCLEHGIDPAGLTTGAVIGLVDLVDVVELDEAAYEARTSEHLSGRHFRAPMFGWELANPRLLVDPQPARGRLLLFEVDISDSAGEISLKILSKENKHETRIDPSNEVFWGEALPFELHLVPEADPKNNQASYRLGLYQRVVEPPAAQRSLYSQSPEQMERLVELSGVTLRAVADQVLEALRENGYKVSDLTPNRREPFSLQEESGVRLGLLFLAVKPLSKVNRIEMISSGIREMTSEELYYWFSKCTSRAIAKQAQTALRILLGTE